MNRWPNLICHPCLPPLRAVMRLANLGGRGDGRVLLARHRKSSAHHPVTLDKTQQPEADSFLSWQRLHTYTAITSISDPYTVYQYTLHTLAHTQDKSHKALAFGCFSENSAICGRQYQNLFLPFHYR